MRATSTAHLDGTLKDLYFAASLGFRGPTAAKFRAFKCRGVNRSIRSNPMRCSLSSSDLIMLLLLMLLMDVPAALHTCNMMMLCRGVLL